MYSGRVRNVQCAADGNNRHVVNVCNQVSSSAAFPRSTSPFCGMRKRNRVVKSFRHSSACPGLRQLFHELLAHFAYGQNGKRSAEPLHHGRTHFSDRPTLRLPEASRKRNDGGCARFFCAGCVQKVGFRTYGRRTTGGNS